MAKAGRKPIYDRPATIAAIVDRLKTGTPLTRICSEPGMPDDNTVRDWMAEDEAIAGAIARAREAGFDAIAADILPIADDKTDDPASRRIRVEARLKLLAKWDPKRYGDKMDITSGGEAFKAPPAAHFWAIPMGDLQLPKPDDEDDG